MSYLVVVPVVLPSMWEGFERACTLPPETVLLVDNGPEPVDGWDGRYHRTGTNLGVAGSWNCGARIVLEERLDWLVIASSAFRFGADGGHDFVRGLEGCEVGAASSTYGWHLVAISRPYIERVGLFDENFYPAYWEETDYLYRLGLAGLPSPRENGQHWCHIPIEADYGAKSHAISPEGGVTVNFVAQAEYYERKWGGPQGKERFKTPFNFRQHDLTWWPGVDDDWVET